MDDIIKAKRRLTRLEKRLNELRAAYCNLRPKQVRSLAAALGRKKSGKRGKELIFVSTILRSSRPLSIPDHPGNLAPGTALSILGQLEADIFSLREVLETEKSRRGSK